MRGRHRETGRGAPGSCGGLGGEPKEAGEVIVIVEALEITVIWVGYIWNFGGTRDVVVVSEGHNKVFACLIP
jgi:hypothetical protein